MEEQVKTLLDEALELNGRAASFDRDTGLLGHLPELDSMAIANLIAALEDDFNIHIDDDDISAETFESVGSLIDFIEEKTRSS